MPNTTPDWLNKKSKIVKGTRVDIPSLPRRPVSLGTKDITRNYIPTFLLNIHVKILNKIPAN